MEKGKYESITHIHNVTAEQQHAFLREVARTDLMTFARYVKPGQMDVTPFHKSYYRLLTSFAMGRIRKLIVQAPPQSGKTEGSSRLLPAFLLGRNPDLRITIGSYSATLANDFNRDVQRIIDTPEYMQLFPDTMMLDMPGAPKAHGALRNSDVFDIVSPDKGRRGLLRAVGRGGALTGKTVDISILDDVYKDYSEAVSPLIRDSAWKWYTSVVRTRLHNESQEIIVFTRWHDDDIIGRLEKSGENIVDVKSIHEAETLPQNTWARVNFEAIRTGEPTEIDGRERGEALWPERHSLQQLLAARDLDPVGFQCLYQGNPSSAEAHMYQPFKTYVRKEEYGKFVRSGCYIDVADKGADMLAAVCYDIYISNARTFNESTRRWEPILYALVTDIVYTSDNTDVTLVTVPAMINGQNCDCVYIESNNGGAQYEKALRGHVRCRTIPFFQRDNKETRIVGLSAFVNKHIVFPYGWETRFKDVHDHLMGFLSDFRANRHDDIEDAITGIYERELADKSTKQNRRKRVGIRRMN